MPLRPGAVALDLVSLSGWQGRLRRPHPRSGPSPASILSWGMTPWLTERIGGRRDPFTDALLICFNIGLMWMIALVLILVRRAQGSLSWTHIRDALWLRAPRDPKSGRVGGRVWWWVLPFTLFSSVVNGLGIDPIGPLRSSGASSPPWSRVIHQA